MARYIGVDLHRNQFTVCVLAENGREYLSEHRLEQLPQFVWKLRPTDELAVEVTGNTRLFYSAVVSHMVKVVVVNPTQFRVIRQSAKKFASPMSSPPHRGIPKKRVDKCLPALQYMHYALYIGLRRFGPIQSKASPGIGKET